MTKVAIATKLSRELSTLTGTPVARLLAASEALEQLRGWTRRALSRTHVVAVARELRSALGADEAALEQLGIATDLLTDFPAWRDGSRAGFRPSASGLRPPLQGASHPLGTLRLQISPHSGSIPFALRVLGDLLRCTDGDVRFVVAVEPGANLPALAALVNEMASNAERRVRFVEVRTATAFAQDSARAMRTADGTPVLLVPRRFRAASNRADDELTPDEAQRAFRIRVVRSRLCWEGGNLLSDGEHCFVGADTIAENVARLGLTASEVIVALGQELGAPVVVLGDVAAARYDVETDRVESSGQASFHIDLDVALLGSTGPRRRPVALVADAARGLTLASRALSRSSALAPQFLPLDRVRDLVLAEYDAHARERHPRLLEYAAALEQRGFRAVGVPDLRIERRANVFGSVNLDITYCNVLPGLHRGRPAVYYLPWGNRALDADAEARYRAAGVAPVRVSSDGRVAAGLMQLAGGLHCLCGSL